MVVGPVYVLWTTPWQALNVKCGTKGFTPPRLHCRKGSLCGNNFQVILMTGFFGEGRGVTMGHRSLLTGFMFMAVLLIAACGSDEAAPGIPTFSSEPDMVFFNTGSAQPGVLFEGRATDNRWVEQVLISFDNAATWHTAQIDPVPSVRDVKWSYFASETDMPSTSTVLLWAVDQDGNETTSSPVTIEKQTGSTVGNLLTVLTGASAGDVIALSSGHGGAYGDSTAALTVPIDVSLDSRGCPVHCRPVFGGCRPFYWESPPCRGGRGDPTGRHVRGL